MDLSIIIVSYNTREHLQSCLRSILETSEGFSYEIVVIDNNSRDGSADLVGQEFRSVRLIRNSTNNGFAAANNQGFAIATGEYLLLLNPDTIVRRDSLRNTLDFMKRHPEASIVGCRLLNEDGTIQRSCRSFPSVLNLFFEASFLYKLFPKNSLIGKYYLGWFTYDKVKEVDVVLGAFMMIRRSVFERIGNFDEKFFMFTEETDFCIRAKRAGLRTFFYPGAEVVHLGGQSAGQESQRMYRDIYRTQLYLFRKHFSHFEYVLMALLRAAGVAVRVLVYAMFGVFARKPAYLQKSRFYFGILFR